MSLLPVARWLFYNKSVSNGIGSCLIRECKASFSTAESLEVVSARKCSIGKIQLSGSVSRSNILEKCCGLTATALSPSKLLDTSRLTNPSSQSKRLYHARAFPGLLGTHLPSSRSVWNIHPLDTGLLTPLPTPMVTPKQNLQDFYGGIKCSMMKGRRKTVKGVIRRFYRLDWGAWISPKPGRFRHLWRKDIQRRNRLRKHIFRSGPENAELDRMMTKYWVKKKYWVDDPYESYHTRDNFWLTKDVQGIDSIKLKHVKPYNGRRIKRPNMYFKKFREGRYKF